MKIPLRATNVRPDNATLLYSFSLFKNKRAFWFLQIPATILFFLYGWFFLWCTIKLRPELIQSGSLEIRITLPVLLALMGSMVLAIVLHELVHGLFFRVFTRSQPTFGFRGGFAYAAAQGWYFPRSQYLVVALAPFILLSNLGIILLAVVPTDALVAILSGMVVNAAGSVGDLWIVFLVIRERKPILIEDLGDGFNFYALS